MRVGIATHYGSSFDGMNKKNNGQNMDVLNRWKHVEDDENFIELKQDERVNYYAEKLGFEL